MKRGMESKRIGKQRRATRVVAEALDRRLLMSGNPPAVLANGVLTITGTSAADAISVTFSTDQSTVTVTGTFTTVVNGTTQSFNTPGTTSVVINSGQGNDTITVNGVETYEPPAGTTLIPVNVSDTSGDGNDSIAISVKDSAALGGGTTGNPSIGVTVGNGNDHVTTYGAANVQINAGSGSDTLQSSQYQDLLNTSIYAGDGSDTFIAGSTLTGNQAMVVNAGLGSDTFENTDPHDSLQVNLGEGSTADGESFYVANGDAALAGTAFVDENGTGVYAVNDPILPDTEVYLDDNNDGAFDNGESGVVTTAAGLYVINNLDPTRSGTGGDTYTSHIRVAPTAGYTSSDQAVTENLGVGQSNVNPYLIPATTRLTGTVMATAGSYNSDGNTAANAVDGNLSTFFDGPTANGDYIGLNLGSPQLVTSIQYAARPGFASRMVGGIFQGSNSANFSSATTLYTVTTAPTAGVYTTASVAPGEYQYVRYVAPAGSYGNIAEMQFYGITAPPVTVSNGVLAVTGTQASDNLAVVISIVQDGEFGGLTGPVNLGTYTVILNGVTTTFDAAAVTDVQINTLGGNDTVSVTGTEQFNYGPANVPVNISILAGDGNDGITTGVTSINDGGGVQPMVAVSAGDGDDTVSLGGTVIQATLGNGDNAISTTNTGSVLEATIVAGNGNDTYYNANAKQSVTLTTGSGADLFTNTDADGNESVQIAGGDSFTVPYSTGVVTGRAFIDSNGDGRYEAGEPVLAGTAVNVAVTYFVTAPLTATVTTDANGNYIFDIPNANSSNASDDSGATVAVTAAAPVGYNAVTVSAQLVFYAPNGTGGSARTGLNPSIVKQTVLTGSLLATAGSYQNDGNTAAKSVDGNLSTFFDGPAANGNYVGLDLGSAHPITAIAYAPRPGFASRMVGGIFEASNSSNFSSPVTLFTVAATPVVGSLTTVAVTNTGAFRYVRYLSPDGSYGDVAEIQFFTPSVPFAIVSNGTIVIDGTPGPDNISVGASLETDIDQTDGVPYLDGSITVNVNGIIQHFSPAGISSVSVVSGDGNDTINVYGSEEDEDPSDPEINFYVLAGNGNDGIGAYLNTEDGNDAGPIVWITAGNGNDNLYVSGTPVAEMTVGNGNDSVDLHGNGNGEFSASVTAGNGNDTFVQDIYDQSASIQVGSGHDLFEDFDEDNSQIVSVTDGLQFSVSEGSGEITGRAYVDTNGDGIYEPGEPVLANAQVYIDVNHDGIFDAGDIATTTDGNGNYLFTGLTQTMGTSVDNSDINAITYSVVVTPPAGDKSVAVPVTLYFLDGPLGASGASGVNMPVVPAGALTGTLVATTGSYNSDGNTAANAVDGNLSTYFDGPTANGDYVGLNLGTPTSIATISYAPRAGYASRMVGGIFQGSNNANFSSAVTLYTITTAPTAGVLTTVASVSTTPFQYVRYLAPAGSYGNAAEVQFFANPAVGSISVHLFNDTNGNGVQDAGEAGLGGFGTFLDLNDNGVFDGNDIREIADTSGNMTFSNLPAGTYWLEQMVPAGYKVTTPTTGFPIQVTVAANSIATVTVGEQFSGVTRLSGTAIGTAGSYNNSGNTIANAFDGNLVTYFDGPTASGSWVGLDLGTAQVATEVQFSPRPSFESRMIGGEIQASNTADFSSGVVTLATITTTPTPGVLNTLSFSNSTAYRYYRYIGPANSYCDIAELEFFATV